jgi:hypothetical protein
MRSSVALVGHRLDPNGKELGAEVARFGLVKTEVALVLGIRRSDVPIFVEESLWSIGVGVDDDGRVLDLKGLLANCGLCIQRESTSERDGDGETVFVHGDPGVLNTILYDAFSDDDRGAVGS